MSPVLYGLATLALIQFIIKPMARSYVASNWKTKTTIFVFTGFISAGITLAVIICVFNNVFYDLHLPFWVYTFFGVFPGIAIASWITAACYSCGDDGKPNPWQEN